MESLKIGIRDLFAFGGLIVTIMATYYSLRAEIRDIAGDRKIYELRIQLLETSVEKLKMDVETLKYDNTDKHANQNNATRRNGR